MEPDAPTPVEVEPGDPRLDEFRGIRDRELRGWLGLRHEAGTIGELAACLARGALPARDALVAMDGITQTDNVGAIFRNAASTATRSSRARTRRTP